MLLVPITTDIGYDREREGVRETERERDREGGREGGGERERGTRTRTRTLTHILTLTRAGTLQTHTDTTHPGDTIACSRDNQASFA